MINNIVNSIKDTLRSEFNKKDYAFYYDPTKVGTKDGFLINFVNHSEKRGVSNLLFLEYVFDIIFINSIEKKIPAHDEKENRYTKAGDIIETLYWIFLRMTIKGFENDKSLEIEPERQSLRVGDMDHFFLTIRFFACRNEKYIESGDTITNYTLITNQEEL